MILFKFFILGILTSFLFPPFFILPLGFVIIPYLVELLLKNSHKNSYLTFFYYGFFYGLGFLSVFLSWIHNPFLVFDDTKSFAILSILLPIFISIFFGIGFIIYKFIKNLLFIIIITPFIFLFIEFIISNFLYGFPWISYSLILSNNLVGFYLLKYYGTLASSFLIIFSFTIPCWFIYKKKFKINNLIKFSYLTLLLFLIFPFTLNYSNEYKKSNELNIDIHQIFSPIKNIDKKKVEEIIINKIKNSNSEYIIFAENNYPYLITESNDITLTKHLGTNQKVVIGGTKEIDGKFFNSFLFIEKDKIQYFHKKILVPFGEFLPFRKYIQFMDKISGTTDYTIGNIDRLIISKENINILPIICYEILFDQIYKNLNKDQIDLLINITNDSWFGTKVGPYQHLYLARIKSLVANKPLVRVSNNGISAVIDNDGNIIKFSKLNQKSNLTHKLKINYKKNYFLAHKILYYYLIILFIFFLAFNWYKRNEDR